MSWKIFLSTFMLIFLAELGDKTQLACMLMTAKSGKPWTVFVASALALSLVSLLGVLVANILCQYVSPQIIKKTAAVGFVAIGLLIFFDKF